MRRVAHTVLIASPCIGAGYFVGRQSTCSTGNPDSHQSVCDSSARLDVASKLFSIFKQDLHAATLDAPEDSAVVPVQSFPNAVQNMVRYGFPSTDNLRSYEDFMLSYDRRTRIPNWVLEHLTPEKVIAKDGVERSKMKFVEDQSVHEFHRASNKDYQGSGYDRGHMAAAANHRQTEKAMRETFTLSNIAPQVGEGFNRDVWNNLEKYVRALARKNKNVYVCTGPLFLPQYEPNGKLYVKYEVIGSNHVAVPTHFFKIVVIENNSGHFDLQSFVMPNQALPKDTKLQFYLTPLEVIERSAGLNFFQNIPKGSFRKINAPPAIKS